MNHELSSELGRVQRAAASLSRLELEVLTLSAGRGLRNDQIAERLGISERRAERLLARALRKFDGALRRPDRPWWNFP